jgi:xanthine dehydrogenase molybdenum-binding subunit
VSRSTGRPGPREIAGGAGAPAGAQASPPPARPFRVIGTRVTKLDAVEKVTGAVQYLPDLEMPGMVWGKILRTRVPHARITRIDTTRAEALPGVLGVVTGRNVLQRPFGYAKDHLALKTDIVRCIRDEVAAVAAETEEIATEACRLIDVDYEELPAVFDPEAALRPEAPRIHPQSPGNRVNFTYKFTAGDVDRAFREADVVVEGTYRLNYVTTACLGTMAAAAQWDPRGNLTMWSMTQIPFLYQKDLAEALGISGDRIRVIQPPVGGNFGRGLDLYPIDIIAALLARHVGRPVKIVFDREEEFVASPTREPCVFTLRTAARADGTLLARDARVLIDNGAYVSWGSTTPYVMMTTLAGFYRCPNIRFDTAIVYTNNVYSGSMRGYGNLESTFAVEAQMDDLAERLGLDRLEIRRRNANRPGDVTPQGLRITSCALTECFDAVARDIRRPVERPLRPGWVRGIGYAGMFHVGGGARVYRSDGCGAIVKLDDFGKVTLITGASEIGQGSETVLAMIVAEELGRWRPREPDHVHRGQRRPPGGAGREAAAPRAWRSPARRAGRGARRRRRVRVRYGGAPAPDGVRAGRPGGALPGGRSDPDGPGVLRSADPDAGQGLPGQRVGDVRVRGAGGPGRGGGGDGQDRGGAGRLGARRGAGPESGRLRGPDRGRHPHGARLLPHRGAPAP